MDSCIFSISSLLLDIIKYYKPILDIKMKLFPHIMVNMIIIVGVGFLDAKRRKKWKVFSKKVLK